MRLYVSYATKQSVAPPSLRRFRAPLCSFSISVHACFFSIERTRGRKLRIVREYFTPRNQSIIGSTNLSYELISVSRSICLAMKRLFPSRIDNSFLDCERCLLRRLFRILVSTSDYYRSRIDDSTRKRTFAVSNFARWARTRIARHSALRCHLYRRCLATMLLYLRI